MKTVTITQEIMNDIESLVVCDGNQVDYDEELNITTFEHNDNTYWFDAEGNDDSCEDGFYYDATWYGHDDGEDEGRWEYSVKVGDVVELI